MGTHKMDVLKWKTLSFKWMIWGETPLFLGNIQIDQVGIRSRSLFEPH